MNFEPLVPMRDASTQKDSVVRLEIGNPNELAEWILSEVGNGVPLQDMVLLVRKIRGNEKWIKALTSKGIPIAIGSGGLFWEDPRVRELVAFLRWWNNPGNTLSGAVFLRAPWIGISDEELDRWIKQDPSCRKQFFDSQHPVALALQPYLKKTVRPGELLLALLVNQEIEDEISAPLLGLWHRVEELSSRGFDFHTIVTELSSSVDESRREREVPAPRNLGQLTIMTIHGSKGLEFPHVILIDFGEKTRSADTPLLFWDRKQGAYLGRRDENGDRDRKSHQEVLWREIEKQKSIAESKRLFYVALTRARERLVLVCADLKEPEDLAPAEEARRLDYWRAWLDRSGFELPRVIPRELNLQKTTLNLSFKPQNPLSRNRVSCAVPMTRARHSVTEWTLLSRCERAYEWTYIRPLLGEVRKTGELETEVFQGEEISALREGRVADQRLGTRVHACLERHDFEGLRKIEEELGKEVFNAQPVIEWAENSPWMAPAHLSEGRDVWTELAFEVPLQGEILVGSIDRIVLEQKGNDRRYSIIDFKVTDKKKSISQLMKAYHTQIELYAWALTALEPELQFKNISAMLVNITSNAVQTVPMGLGQFDLNSLFNRSLEVIDGRPGKPNPSAFCRFCEFRTHCPEAQISESILDNRKA